MSVPNLYSATAYLWKIKVFSAKMAKQTHDERTTCAQIQKLTYNILFLLHTVQEQSTNFKVLAESEDIAVIGENSPTEEDDDGDWEQVGPRNKSMVTRMVRHGNY